MRKATRKGRTEARRPRRGKARMAPVAASWEEFLELVSAAREDLRFLPTEECFYRGHSRATYELLPTLLRAKKRHGWDVERLWDVENDLFFEFQARARELAREPLSDWDILQFMRHHGLATRLLDWTETLGVAFYFAILNAGDGDGCLWLLNPYAMNEAGGWTRDLVAPRFLAYEDGESWTYSDLLTDSPGMGWDDPVALYPVQKSSRLQAQRGYFTIHGDIHEPLDLTNPDFVRQVRFTAAIVEPANEFLSMAGIDEYLLFPDLDALSRTLHRKYGM